jgi:hypothetical protein
MVMVSAELEPTGMAMANPAMAPCKKNVSMSILKHVRVSEALRNVVTMFPMSPAPALGVAGVLGGPRGTFARFGYMLRLAVSAKASSTVIFARMVESRSVYGSVVVVSLSSGFPQGRSA